MKMRQTARGQERSVRLRTIACAIAFGLAGLVAISRGEETPVSIPRGPSDNTEALGSIRRQAIEQTERQAASVNTLRASASHRVAERLGLGPKRPAPTNSAAPRLLYFTSRTCSVCDADLDHLVHDVIDRHPEITPEVVYLGNPLVEYPEAASVFVSFADDVIARWRERLRDPAVVTALAHAGKVNDASGRVRVSFATHEAESRGIAEVPAFVLAQATTERIAIGRPASARALEAALGLSGARGTP